MNGTIDFFGLSAGPGQTARGSIAVPGTAFQIPATLINGSVDGKTVLITGGIHSCEYVGIQAAIELGRTLDPRGVRGAVLLLHPVNRSGFEARRPALVPEDGKNLNRMFPGDAGGTAAQRLARFMTDCIYPRIDFYLDLHGGEIYDSLTPYVYYAAIGTGAVTAAARRAAEQADVPYMVRSLAETGAYNWAARCGVPSVLLERGCGGRIAPGELEAELRDCRRILCSLGVISACEPRLLPPPAEICEVCYRTADTPGLWYPAVDAGDIVAAGQTVGVMRDYWGRETQRCTAPFGGVILYLTRTLWADGFSDLFALGRLDSQP